MTENIFSNTICYIELNSDLEYKLPDVVGVYANLSSMEAAKDWFLSINKRNTIKVEMINHNNGVMLAIGYKYASNYGAVLYFGYGLSGVNVLTYIDGIWS